MTLLWVFLRRDAAVEVSYRFDLLLQLATAIFILALFFYLGGLIDESTFANQSEVGGGYFDFVVIGLALFRIVQTGVLAYATRIRQDQITGTLEALFASPTSPSLLILYTGAFDIVRATVEAMGFIALAALIFDFSAEPNLLDIGIVLAAFLGSIPFFVSLGVMIAALTIVVKQTTNLVGLVASFLGLLGGAFFPTSSLPGPLEAIGDALPFTWSLDLMRSALLSGETDLSLLGLEWGVGLLLVPLSLYVFNRALRRARRDGSLAQY